MLCEECKKTPATVVVTTVSGGKMTSRHLCAACVQKFQQGDMQGFLAAILASMAAAQAGASAPGEDIVCAGCGLSFSEFQKTGKLGCARCYTDFREQLKPILMRIHGRALHAGRRPPVSEEEQAVQKRKAALREQMEQAVKTEDFERAAALRDELRAMTVAREENDHV